ncbi:hypothetical protein [Neotabrizicola shimadae]|uniref:hypothetical protein n=1 Tax=Neotabrizicola shimadae TaxID=2807096 RepID=UPI002176C82C|nr:hypothetical protein [Neotabrizicola shimadae]
MPNAVALLALLSWPLVTLVLWQRLDPARALIWTILGAYLILPPSQAVIALPGLPDLDKYSVSNLMALACAVFLLKDRVSFVPETPAGRFLVLLYVFSPFATVLTNDDPVVGPGLWLPGMTLYDSLSVVAGQAITITPYFLARRYLATPHAARAILVALVAGGLAYVPPMLIEARLSPQINIWVYGFFAHDFSQAVRFGGYRPMVFLPHGLWLALFVLMSFLSALTLARLSPAADRAKWVGFALILALALVLARSVGPMFYAVALTPMILLAGARTQVLVAGVLAAVVITYPLLRGLHLVPIDTVMALAHGISADRAQSFEFRVMNEEALLAHGAARPLFGWGGYGRNMLHDPVTGKTLSVSDGMWIIRLGMNGWLGYIAEFGLLTMPLLLLARVSARRLPAPAVAAVALIYAANLVDLLPNATLVPLTWMIGGALLGQAEALRRAGRTVETAGVTPVRTVI